MDKKFATAPKQNFLKRPLTLPLINLCILSAMILVLSQPNKSATASGFYLDTIVSVTVYGQSSVKKANELAESALTACGEYERLFSRTIEGSDIWNINHAEGKPVHVSPLTTQLLRDAIDFAARTDGAVDPTVLSLDTVWDISFRISDPAFVKPLPDADSILSALALVDYTTIHIIDEQTVSMGNPKSGVDLGFIAKGFIADKLKELLVESGVKSCLINLGGNIVAWGRNEEKKDFTIGIQSPFEAGGKYIETVTFTNKSIVTSGTYERYFRYDGIEYTHIFDTKTGYPINSDLVSATILTADSYAADALSTACLILGEEQGLALIEGIADTEALFVTKEGAVVKSSGF